MIGVILGVILGLYWDNGKENGNYYTILVGFPFCTLCRFLNSKHARRTEADMGTACHQARLTCDLGACRV